jgi:hypothetical protein
MVIQLPHAEGGFGVPFNCVTKDAEFNQLQCILDALEQSVSFSQEVLT